MDFRLGELFSGPGGMGYGALQSKINANDEIIKLTHAWASDYDFDSCQTYINNITPNNPSSVYCKDVRELDMTKLSPIDALAFGFPCNDFSIVGEQKGINGRFGGLFSYGVDCINHHRPKFFVAENVGGLASANEGKALIKITEELSNAGNGYHLTIHLYRSEDYGIAQTRHRIIVVGIDKSLNKIFKVPMPTTAEKPPNSQQAIEIPPIPSFAPNHEFSQLSDVVAKRLSFIKPGQNVWTADLPEDLRLNVKGAKLSQIYKRLDPHKPSYTITGSGGGGTHGYHWSENRALTNRERARIQSFADDFVFYGKKESVRKQIGMAVPPKLSQVIFTAILKTLSDVSYESIPAKFTIRNPVLW